MQKPKKLASVEQSRVLEPAGREPTARDPKLVAKLVDLLMLAHPRAATLGPDDVEAVRADVLAWFTN